MYNISKNWNFALTPFFMTERQIENPGKGHRRNIPKSSYMKFYPIWSSSWGDIASDGPTDRRNGDYLLREA